MLLSNPIIAHFHQLLLVCFDTQLGNLETCLHINVSMNYSLFGDLLYKAPSRRICHLLATNTVINMKDLVNGWIYSLHGCH